MNRRVDGVLFFKVKSGLCVFTFIITDTGIFFFQVLSVSTFD